MGVFIVIAVVFWIFLPTLGKLRGKPGGRAVLAIGFVVVAGSLMRWALLLPHPVIVAAALVYFGTGGVLFAWDRWQAAAPLRLARAKSAAVAPQRMRKALPPAAPAPPRAPAGPPPVSTTRVP